MDDMMSSVFDQISNMDLDRIFENSKEDKASEKRLKEIEAEKQKKDNEKNKEIKPEDCLYDKTYNCPVCESKFKARTIRKGKTRFVGSDIDLHSNYDPINPDYYDVIMCDNCGYASISNTFYHIGERQSKLIADNISIRYVHKDYPLVYDTDIAIERYKLALLNCMAKNAKAYICLKLGWLYRDKKDIENEIKHLRFAIEGFNEAFTNENFPICGLDEQTLLYIMAALNFRLGEADESKRILSRLIVKRNLPERLKKKAEDLKELIAVKEKKDEK